MMKFDGLGGREKDVCNLLACLVLVCSCYCNLPRPNINTFGLDRSDSARSCSKEEHFEQELWESTMKNKGRKARGEPGDSGVFFIFVFDN